MSDLLDLVLDAHGGLKRWLGVSTLTAKLAAGGPFWGQQGFPDAFLDETLTIDVRRQHAVFTPWTAPGQSLTFDTDPERVVLQTADGQTIDSRTRCALIDLRSRSTWSSAELRRSWVVAVGPLDSSATWPSCTSFPDDAGRESGGALVEAPIGRRRSRPFCVSRYS